MNTVEKVLAQPADVIPEASSPTICAISVGVDTAGTYDVNIRFEDAFNGLEGLAATIAEGERVEIGGLPAYWAPGLHTLWVQAGDLLLAVQLIRSDLEEAAAREVAERLADVAVKELAP